jgi:GH24 family phage-related lysozyme (muramidase)
VEGRSTAVARTEGLGTARAFAAHPYTVVAGIWTVWAGAVVATVSIGIAAGTYERARAAPRTPLFPLFSWDFG